MRFEMKTKQKALFQILRFYNVLIEKTKIKHLSNLELLHQCPRNDELSAVEISKTFKRYARSYKIEVIDLKVSLAQLEASKSSIEDFFKYLLNEMKGYKYQITVTVLLCKHKTNGDIEYCSAYFNSTTKTVTYFDKYDLAKSFQEVLYRIDNWINEGSCWKTESIEAQYVNISIYSLLIGSTYIELPDKLKNPMKGMINIKNNDKNFFLWCHIRHLNPLRITKSDKK